MATRRMGLALALLLAVAIGAATASAGGSAQSASSATDKARIAALEKRVASLEKQLKQVTRRERQLEAFTAANYAADACLTALTADLIQAAFITIDDYLFRTFAVTLFGPQTSLDDKGSCKAVGIERAPGVWASGLERMAQLAGWYAAGAAK